VVRDGKIGIITMLLNQNFRIELGPTTNSKQFQGNSSRGKHFGGKLRTYAINKFFR
jgi:hypothetical protein